MNLPAASNTHANQLQGSAGLGIVGVTAAAAVAYRLLKDRSVQQIAEHWLVPHLVQLDQLHQAPCWLMGFYSTAISTGLQQYEVTVSNRATFIEQSVVTVFRALLQNNSVTLKPSQRPVIFVLDVFADKAENACSWCCFSPFNFGVQLSEDCLRPRNSGQCIKDSCISLAASAVPHAHFTDDKVNVMYQQLCRPRCCLTCVIKP